MRRIPCVQKWHIRDNTEAAHELPGYSAAVTEMRGYLKEFAHKQSV
jgi:hypothetical protein